MDCYECIFILYCLLKLVYYLVLLLCLMDELECLCVMLYCDVVFLCDVLGVLIESGGGE